MKTMLVINSVCMERNARAISEKYQNARWGYVDIIKDLNCNETLYFNRGAFHGVKSSFIDMLLIECGAKVLSAPVIKIDRNCSKCFEPFNNYDYSIHESFLSASVIQKAIQFKIEEVIIVGLDRATTATARVLRDLGISVLGYTFQRYNNPAMKSCCNLGIHEIDAPEELDKFVLAEGEDD